jgi:hypothetical protein
MKEVMREKLEFWKVLGVYLQIQKVERASVQKYKTDVPIGQPQAKSVRMPSTSICVSYIQLAAYVPYHVPPRVFTRQAYVPTSPTRTLLYHSQPTRTCP